MLASVAIGIDCSDAYHDISAPAAEEEALCFRIANAPEGFTKLRAPSIRSRGGSPSCGSARLLQVLVSAVDEALGRRQVLRLLRVVPEELRALEAEIETRFEAHPDVQVFRLLPGAGPSLAFALLGLSGCEARKV